MSGHPQEGAILAGKYLVERVIHTAGMSVVVAARHAPHGERVAVEILTPEALDHPDIVARFLREGRAAAVLQGEHVARIHGVGTLEDGAPYLAMEHLEGSDLGAVLAQQGPLACDAAVDYILQACEGLAEAHALGVVHRGLTPASLLLTRGPGASHTVKLTFGGLSRLAAAPSASAGGDEGKAPWPAIAGSPRYMAPEQMPPAGDVDARSDIWALGAILYYLIAGLPPFNGDSVVEVYAQIQRGPLPLLSARAGIPRGLAAVVERCMKVPREERFPDVGALAAALVAFAPPHGRSAAERVAWLLGGFASPAAASPGGKPPWDAGLSAPLPRRPALSRGSQAAMAVSARSAPASARLLGRIAAGSVILVLVAFGLRAYLSRMKPPMVPVGPPPETLEERQDRLARVCEAMRANIYKGAPIGPYEADGWVIELWLGSRSALGPGERDAIAWAVQGGQITPSADEALSRVSDGTLKVEEGAGSAGGRDVTLTFGGGYARAFFDPAERPRFLALAEHLAERTGAEAAALYGRCAHLTARDVGAFFRGRDAALAAAALLYGVGLSEEPRVVDRGALARFGGKGDLDALAAAAAGKKLDGAALRALVAEEGGSVTTAKGAVSLSFPAGGPLRARSASRAVARKLGVGGE